MKTGIFTFGDKLPAGKETDIFVSYRVDGFPGGMLSGPYDNQEVAESELRDILTYGEAKDVKLVRRTDLYRAEFYPYTNK